MLRGGEGKATASLQILAPLGAGGFGAVYEAVDLRTGQRVAVKQLDDTSADSIARFKHEFRALADCHHENLVGLRELIEQDGSWLIVMELVPGTDFLRYVRHADNQNELGGLGYDEGRLRKALVGMVHGLQALHAFGVVHRDLKPSNVRVRPDGRAVLLDFGLATSVDPKKQSTHAMGVGTVIYMAPEQAGGGSLGPAVDMYALGVCLFEALTGQAPFEGTHAIKILLDKQRLPAPRAKSLVERVPYELDELCARLLAIEPEARPTPEEVLGILTRSPVRPSQPTGAFTLEPSFAGREGELAHLTRALALTNDGEQRLVLIEGESGVGKSELVSEFLRRAASTHPRFVSLRGRCYENEQVSYKAFDGGIDELATFLRRLSDRECAALLPERGGLLGQLFPVLRKVPAIVKASREGSSADPTARRLEAFAALSQLLSRIAEDRPLVLVLDDLQWADSESFRLLHALRAQTPRAPILLLATLRPREELDPELDAQIEQLRKWRETGLISLFGLPEPQAKVLARRLLGANAPEHLVGLVVEESQGHPLFMSELVQYTHSHDFSTRSSLTIDAALRARVDGLDRPARELLEMVALAARPYPGIVFAGALSCNIEETARKLLAKKLLRQRRGHELGCFHDRIRHAAVSLIARVRLPALHHQLAAALDAFAGADPSEKAQHWDLAGKPELASAAYEQAAENALAALAFTRAAELFGRAVALLSDRDDGRIGPLTARRADALAWAGRSAEAAQLFQQAADRAEGEERIRLRSSVALHTMISAQIEPGIEAASQLMRELGFAIPKGRLAWLLRFAWDVLRLRFTRVQLSERPTTIAEAERVVFMAARGMLRALGVIHPRLYFGLLMQFTRRAANLGLRSDTAQSLTMRAWLTALRGSLDKARPLLEQARTLMVGETNPYDLAAQAYLTGSAHMIGLDWTGSLPYLREAERIAQEHCPEPWLLTVIRYHLGGSLYHCGHSLELARESERWLAEARERKHLLGAGLLAGMGCGFVRHLMRDDPQAALDELSATIAALPSEPYSFVHAGGMIGGTLTRLYMGGTAALSFFDQHEASYKGAFLHRGRSARDGRTSLRLAALLSAYVAAPKSDRPAMLESAQRVARSLERARSGFVRASLQMSKAQIAACQGRMSDALAAAREAETCFRLLEHTFQNVAAYLVALLEGGVSGKRRCTQIVDALSEQGWREPMRMLTMHIPTMPLLLAQRSSVPSANTQLLNDRYEVTGELGRGGFGSVVAARDVQSGREVALKELTRKGGSSLERFKQEFRTLADIHHEHVVRLEELFEHDGAWYIAMERVDGSDLTSYVRASGACDPERLKKAALGVVRALSALHHRGFVHRDVKPENILVTEQGRAVLIDFGLVARIRDARDAGAVGSPQNAAPEQLHGVLPAPEADVFALALSLYTAISGENPFASLSLAERLQPKQKPPPPLSVPGLEELGLLLQLMLVAQPAARPSLADLLRLLEGESASEADQRSSSIYAGLEEAAGDVLFRGREQEQALLQRVVDDARERGLHIVLVQGESGLGKSALVSHFARRAKGRRLPLETFRGRCYEQERIAFKAFDGLVDQLASFLRELPAASCEALLPRRAALLAQLFPVLGGVPAIADALRKGLPADPAARKQAGIECFAQLLENLAGQCELLLIIDDLQWADEESFGLLQVLSRAADRLPLAILCTLRPSAELEQHAERALADLRAMPCCQVLALEPLEPAALASLAAELLGDLDLARLPQLVRESAGHPLFLRELVEQEKRGVRDASGIVTLDGALSARIGGLEREARDLLTLVALADRPHHLHVYARAIERAELPRDSLLGLLGQGLLQRRGDRLACYHDRIRRAAIAGSTKAERVHAARRLATALNEVERRQGGSGSDAAERARLWDEAGDATEAVAAYEQAGDRALEGLTFARAEQHYARALELLGDEPSAIWQRLHVSRGHALVRAGRSADAARCFRVAAQHARGDAQVRLRVWAAQHLIQSAQFDAGMLAARELLTDLEIALPETDAAAKKRIVWERLRMRLRGTALEQRKTSTQETLALDALHGLSGPVRAVSFLPGSALTTQYLRRALDAGDPGHAARALAFEGLWRVLRKPEQSQEQLFERSVELAASVGDPALLAELDLTRGVAAVSSSNPEKAATHLIRSHERLISQCPGQPWLLTAVRAQLGAAWFYSCQFHELRQTANWVDEARARDDRYAMAALCGLGFASLRHALDDDPLAGLAELKKVAGGWPSEPFSTVQLGLILAANPLLGTANLGREHLSYLEREELRMARSFLTRSPHVRYVRHTACFHALLRCVGRQSGAETDAYIARALEEQRAIAKIAGRVASTTAAYFDGWLQLLSGRREHALRAFARASEGVETRFYQVAAGFMVGRLEGGDAGHARCERARLELKAEGWRDIKRGWAMRIPVTLELCEELVGLP